MYPPYSQVQNILWKNGPTKTFCEKTEVYFRDISSLIPDYLASKEWVGKAGAYGIQGKADCFVDHIVGDLDNVIGLPVTKVMECLHQK